MSNSESLGAKLYTRMRNPKVFFMKAPGSDVFELKVKSGGARGIEEAVTGLFDTQIDHQPISAPPKFLLVMYTKEEAADEDLTSIEFYGPCLRDVEGGVSTGHEKTRYGLCAIVNPAHGGSDTDSLLAFNKDGTIAGVADIGNGEEELMTGFVVGTDLNKKGNYRLFYYRTIQPEEWPTDAPPD